MNKQKIFTVLVLSGGMLAARAHEVDVHGLSLCAKDEVVVAACDLKGKPKKIVSICSSAPTAKDNHVVYRYGTKKKTEMTYLVDSNSNTNKIYRGTYFGGSNQTTVYWFKNNDFLYKIAIPGTGIVHLSALKNDRLILSKDCTSNSVGDIAAKNGLFIEKSSDETFEVWEKGE